MTHSPTIPLRGVRVHNLQGIDVSIPLRQLTVVSGVLPAKFTNWGVPRCGKSLYLTATSSFSSDLLADMCTATRAALAV